MARLEVGAPSVAVGESLSFEVIDRLCLFVEMNCVLEGVFRVSGDQLEAQKIAEACEGGVCNFPLEQCVDLHSVSSALKLYLRSHQQSLLASSAREEVLRVEEEWSVVTVVQLIFSLPTSHRHILRRLLDMLGFLKEHEEVTKMNASNLG